MATLYPELTEGELRTLHSRGEATVYRACRDGLPDDYDVYFSVGWILQRPDRHAHDGETDFVICHRVHGFLTVEVKGGGIGFDATTGAWSSTDRSGDVHPIKDPARQARTAKYSILAKLREHPRWAASGAGRILCGHAVFFPDLNNVESLQRPDLPATLIGSRDDLDSIEEWMRAAFDYWRNEDHTRGAIGESRLTIFRSVFARSFEVRPALHGVLAEEEAERIRLTEDYASPKIKPVSLIVDLISREGVSPRDIAVLIADSPRKAMYYEALRHLPLPKPSHWLEEGTPTENTVLLDTVKRFKGLEAPVVFL